MRFSALKRPLQGLASVSLFGLGWVGYEFYQGIQRQHDQLTSTAGANIPLSIKARLLNLVLTKSAILRSFILWEQDSDFQSRYDLQHELDVLLDSSWNENRAKIWKSQSPDRLSGQSREQIRKLLLEGEQIECMLYNSRSNHMSPVGKILSRIYKHNSLSRREKTMKFATRKEEKIFHATPSTDSKEDGSGLIVLVGQHLTGSNLLLDLLNLDPDARSPVLWQQLSIPPPFTQSKKKKVLKRLEKVDALCPNILYRIKEVHDFGLDQTEADTVMLSPIGLSFRELTLFNNSFGERWFDENREFIGAYRARYLHLCLKLFDNYAMGKPKHWIIRNSDHANYLLPLMDEFPQAKIIVTHRNPEQTVPSLATTMLYIQHLFVANEFRKKDAIPYSATAAGWGQSILRQYKNSTKRLMETRKYLESVDPERAAQIMDVSYSSIISDPVGTVENIYKYYGMEFSDEHRTNIQEFMKKKKHKLDFRNLHTFELTREQIQSDLADYIKQYSDFF